MKPQSIETKNGKILVGEDQSIYFSMRGLEFKINNGGEQVSIQRGEIRKEYRLNNLPQKYFAYYDYAYQVIETLRPRQVLQQIDNHVARFTLRRTAFSATFHDGYHISHQINTNTF